MIESPVEIVDQLRLRQPWWLLLLLIPLCVMVVRRFQPRGLQHRQRLATLIDPELWNWLLTHPENPHHSTVTWTVLLAWILVALAASGPHFSDRSEHEITRSIDIAVVVDISPSMGADDIAPTRLERAKHELRDFSTRLTTERTALIAYSANAYRMLPLTADRNTLHHFSDALDPFLTRKRGSNLSQALEIALSQLKQSKEGARAILLLTDGESFDPEANLAIAERLKKRGIPLLILGIGTEGGAIVIGEGGRQLRHNGEPVVSRLNDNTLQQLAMKSGGLYTRISNDDSDWNVIFAALNRLTPLNQYNAPYQPQQFLLFPWLMAAAIILFLFSGIRELRGSVAALLIAPLLFTSATPTAEASSLLEQWRESRAFNALSDGENAEAAYQYSEINSFNGQLGFGVAAYRQQEWQLAADAFARALQLAESDQQRAQALYNRGNALVRLGWLDSAAQAFKDALRYRENFPRAVINLNLVNEAQAQQGGIQQRNKERPQQVSPQSTHDDNATLANTSLQTPDSQSLQRSRQLSGESHKPSPDNRRNSDDQKEEQAKASNRNRDNREINWNNALQQAQAIDQSLGRQLMQRRFMIQEKEMTVEMTAEEKPW